MAGLVPAIHVFLPHLQKSKAWMPGIKPGMTEFYEPSGVSPGPQIRNSSARQLFLTRIKVPTAESWQICSRPYREPTMPQEAVAVSVFVIAMFAVFMLSLAWVDRRTAK
jgi:hypothetical protein